jgi:hydroxyacylglutathione hydrolase
MLVEQIWTNNAWRNFNYLVACPETLEALVIDPYDAKVCIEVADRHGWQIKQILNTHEHHDHIEGNKALAEASGAYILAHHNAGGKIPGLDLPLRGGAKVTVGSSVQLQVLDTPGHTMHHICLFANSDNPALFSGDTLFNAGAGNCHNGGHPNELYHTFVEQLECLPDATRLYPGHDYIVNNLQFTLDREPNNQYAADLLDQVISQDPNDALVTTLGLEKQINCFFRLDNQEIIENLRLSVTDFPENPDPKTVFLALRNLRNAW